MEELYPAPEEDVGKFLKKMYVRVEDERDSITALVGDVRVIMFEERRFVDPHYDGPR